MKTALTTTAALVLAAAAFAQAPETVQDEYALYDLLAPETASFRTVYDVSVTSSGATVFHDRIGAGLVACLLFDGAQRLEKDLIAIEELDTLVVEFADVGIETVDADGGADAHEPLP